MAQYLIIVAREQVDLCAYLRQAFSGDSKVRIILDRRWGEAQPILGRQPERIDRRAQRGVDYELEIRGFAIARQRE